MHLVTEEYAPLNYKAKYNGKIVGVCADIVKELFRRAKINYTMELYPWEKAYDLALNNPDYAVFATARTPEREKLFKWVGPLTQSQWIFLAKKSKHISIRQLTEAKQYTIGAYQGDVVAEFLKLQGFKKLILSISDRPNIKKIMRDRITLWATTQRHLQSLSKQQPISKLEKVYDIHKTYLYIAFNKSTPDSIIQKLNAILNKMKKSGMVNLIDRFYKPIR